MKASKQTKKLTKDKVFCSNPAVRAVLSLLAVPFASYILLTFTFLVDALYQGLIDLIVGLFVKLGPDMTFYWYPPLKHISFMVLICILSFFIFRSGWPIVVKASYMTVPLAIVFATIGMFLYQWPILVYSLGTVVACSTLYCLYRNKRHWLYYYAVILVAVIMAIFTLSGGEI